MRVTPTKTSQSIRRCAEEKARLDVVTASKPLSLDQEDLLHELQVHQIELKMQNEELRRSHEDLNASESRYVNLYDLAPVGYLTLNEKGLILEANLTAATMLGVARNFLLNKALSNFIFPEDQDAYYLHRKHLIKAGDAQALEMRLLRSDGAHFWAHVQATTNNGECWISLSDISDRKRLEEALKGSELNVTADKGWTHPAPESEPT